MSSDHILYSFRERLVSYPNLHLSPASIFRDPAERQLEIDKHGPTYNKLNSTPACQRYPWWGGWFAEGKSGVGCAAGTEKDCRDSSLSQMTPYNSALLPGQLGHPYIARCPPLLWKPMFATVMETNLRKPILVMTQQLDQNYRKFQGKIVNTLYSLLKASFTWKN